MFGLHYRIGLYTPRDQRTEGYYVLPFFLGPGVAARVDLKADRKARLLRVEAAHREPAAPGETEAALAAELRRLAAWLGLGGIVVAERGDLAAALRAALSPAGR